MTMKITVDGNVPSALKKWFKISAMDRDELYRHEHMIDKDEDDIELELKALEHLAFHISTHLKCAKSFHAPTNYCTAFPTSLEEDERLLTSLNADRNDIAQYRKRCAVVLRLGEKRIFRRMEKNIAVLTAAWRRRADFDS